jgi:hydroxymethylpyrimidine pyrophosphatase-like HAD family hydrolase
MYCRVLACDFDGTGASDGQLAPEVAAALAQARALGFITLLVTGRVLEDIQTLSADCSIFDAVVAENGAVVWFPAKARTIQLGTPPSAEFLAALRAHGVPFQAGAVVVGTWDRHTTDVIDIIRRVGIDGQLIFNRAALMVLPSGINKATGVRRALEELGRSAHNLIAFGDAENDLPLLAMAEVGVAARDAVPAVAACADERLSQPNGAGVARFIHQVIDAGGIVPTPPRHQLVLGHAPDGTPVSIPPSGMNLMVTGDPRSGKSWLAGWVAEELLDRGYQICIVDPEGDYLSLGDRPHVLALGRHLPLPDPTALSRLLRGESLSLVLSLNALSLKDQITYFSAALCEIEGCRAETGLPHWLLVDEAQYFFPEAAPACRHLKSRTGNVLFITHRPGMLAPAIHDMVQGHLTTRTSLDDERYFVTSLLQERGPLDLVAADALASVDLPWAGLLVEDQQAPRWQIFTPGQRITEHTHHARKYADTQLPEDQAFRFLHTGEGRPVLAHNVAEFYAALQSLPPASLRHHLISGDFSRWAADVLGNQRLGSSLRRIERTTATGATVSRAEILACIDAEYAISTPLPVAGRGAAATTSAP